MSETTPAKQSPVATIKNFVVKHERKILVTATAVSTAGCILMRTGIAQHNAFLKEHGLYEQFYQLDSVDLPKA